MFCFDNIDGQCLIFACDENEKYLFYAPKLNIYFIDYSTIERWRWQQNVEFHFLISCNSADKFFALLNKCLLVLKQTKRREEMKSKVETFFH